ncbi:MAG: hypothetical protein ABSG03_31080, partial [Bryobacteraceae bacterium]
ITNATSELPPCTVIRGFYLRFVNGDSPRKSRLVYVQITPLEVYQQYARAVAQHIRPLPVTPS